MSNYLGQSPVFGDFPFQILTGDGGASYTLTYKVSGENGMLVFLNGAVQRPGIDYTAKGNLLTFSSVVSSGVQIFTYGMGLPKSTLAPSDGASLATPTQFDNSQKIATTEFVKRTGLNYGGIVVHSATEAILAADMGKIHLTSTVGSITLTLPAANSVPVGTAFTIFGSGIGAATIQRAGSDTILPNGSAVTSITCGNGDFLTFTVASSSQWYVAGSTQLGYSAAFGSLLSSNGYQKLPSGLIIQWGTTSHTGDAITWTYPIAFPNAVVSVFANMKTDNGSATVQVLGVSAASGSAMLSGVNASGTHSYNWLAVGY